MVNSYRKIIYLVQHGEAKTKEEDPERSLTENGKNEVERVADWAAQAGLKVDKIRHSGKRRAEQTAELFAEKLSLEDKAVAVSGLAPLDDVKPVAEVLQQKTQSVMLVGHLPFLNRLASYLLISNPEQTVVKFRNGGLVGLIEESGNWSVALVVPPDVWGI